MVKYSNSHNTYLIIHFLYKQFIIDQNIDIFCADSGATLNKSIECEISIVSKVETDQYILDGNKDDILNMTGITKIKKIFICICS